jgi:hypothetical protein
VTPDEATATVKRRAEFVASGLSWRFREHQWSYGRWSKKAAWLTWAQIGAAVATVSSVTTALTDNANLGWVAAAFSALALGVTEYQRRAHPEETAAAHKRAADGFSTLASEYRDFIGVEIPDLPPESARRRFGELQKRRRKLIEDSIATEEKAREAIAAKDAKRRAARKAERAEIAALDDKVAPEEVPTTVEVHAGDEV